VLRALRRSDLPQAAALSREAGWNQLPEDWERLLLLQPDGCFAVEYDGKLAATTTVVCYGMDLAWIGMVLTAARFRRRGFGAMLLTTALEFADRRGIATVGLDATPMGAPLYRKFGFVDEGAVERWQHDPIAITATRESSTPAGTVTPFALDPRLDREIFGADRSALLSILAGTASSGRYGSAYAMGRLGDRAAYFGPCVSPTPTSVRPLRDWFLSKHAEVPVIWDLFPTNSAAVGMAKEAGFVPLRRLTRMVRPGRQNPVTLRHPAVFAIAGFEFG